MKILTRKKVNNELQDMIEKPLTLMSAPMGFGKTTALVQFFEKKEYDHILFSMSDETDGVWVFKRIVQELSFYIKDYDLQTFTIPTQKSETCIFIDYLQHYLKNDLFVVFDDFEWDKPLPHFYQFIKNMCALPCKHLHFVVVSREQPTNEFLELVYQNRCLLYTKATFTFSRADIDALFKMHGISLEQEKIDYIEKYSGGWIAAIHLLLQVYTREHNFYNLSSVDSLIETAFYNRLQPQQQIWMMKLSILKSFTFQQAEYLCETKQVCLFINELEKENCFLRKIGHKEYTIVPVLNDMLNREFKASKISIQSLYKRSGDWFALKKEPIYALKFYLSIESYDDIIDIFKTYNDISLTDIAPELIQNIYDKMPEHYKVDYPYIYLKWICDNMTNICPEKGLAMLKDFEKNIVVHLPEAERTRAKGEYYFIKAFSHYNDARKMMADFHKAYDYFDHGKSMFAYPQMVSTFGSFHILYLYFNQIGDFENLVHYIEKNLKYFIHISGGVNMGSEKQTLAEYKFEIGQYEQVEELAILAYEKAKTYQQTSISFCSLFLRGRLALINKNEELYKTMFSQILDIKETTDIPIIKSGADCAIAYLCALHGDIEMIPRWIKEGQIDNSALLYEAKLVGCIAYGQYLISSKEYKKLLAISERLEDPYQQTTHILGIVYAKLFKTIANLHLHGVEKAFKDFCDLIYYCKTDKIMTPILERSKELEEFLGIFVPIDDYDKKLVSEIEKACYLYTQKETAYHLSKKEREVMQHVSQNKTMVDISKNMNISMNTVQTHMKSIYRKLKVNTKLEAIRVYERDILDIT